MLFIQAISQISARDNKKDFLRLRTKSNPHRRQDDVVTISSTIPVELELTSDNRQAITAEMCILAHAIETMLGYLCNQKIEIRSLDELDTTEIWQLPLQRPPIQTSEARLYDHAQKTANNEYSQYRFKLSLTSSDGHSIEQSIQFFTHQRIQRTLTWPTNAQATELTLKLPYPFEFLQQQPSEIDVLFDQDGEVDQLQTLMRRPPRTILNPIQSALFHQSRLWILHKDDLHILMLGDRRHGGLFLGNVAAQRPQHASKNETEKEAHHYIDTKA